MNETTRNNIHDAAEKFASAIEALTGPKARVVVFYAYLEDNGEEATWSSGDAGNMNWFERRGALEFLAEMEALGNAGKLDKD